MSEARVEIQVDTAFQVAFEETHLDQLLVEVAETALQREHVTGPDRVTLMITNDEALRRLNRDFMGYDEPTDVLSFNNGSGNNASGNNAPGFELAPDSTALDSDAWPDIDGEESDALGDIAISYERAVAQAHAAGHDLARELSILTAHGVLHLLGYDHAEPEEHRVMFDKTDEILSAVAGLSGRHVDNQAGSRTSA
ncbi:MAG: rRNA maturation RNase YbeY [Chloroflexi bacterium]|nr:rRNA maturation RNase YbeY [Chloroflexota bacterium]